MIDGYANMPFEEQQAIATHLQIEIAAPDGTLIIVDEGVAVLLRTLWRLGYETRFSCQGGDADNIYNINASDEIVTDGYIYFEVEEMAISAFSVISSIFPVKDFPLYNIDSRAVLRFSPYAIPLIEYAFRYFKGDASYGSKDVAECLTKVALPEDTEAERRLVKHLLQLLPASES